MLYFSIQMLVLSAKSNLRVAPGGNGLGSFSDHARIGRALEMTFQLFSANFCQMLGCHFAWQAQYLVTFVAPRVVNDVSYVTRIKHASHSVWQARYLVKLKCHFSWQAQ